MHMQLKTVLHCLNYWNNESYNYLRRKHTKTTTATTANRSPATPTAIPEIIVKT